MPESPVPLMTTEAEEYMAFEGLVQWAQAVVTQSDRVSKAHQNLCVLGSTTTRSEWRQDVHTFHTECHFFSVAAHQLLEFRNWAVSLGLCGSVDFAEIDKFSGKDIQDLRNMREYVVEYFRGKGHASDRWVIQTLNGAADASSVIGTLIGGRLDWVAFGMAAAQLLPQLSIQPTPIP